MYRLFELIPDTLVESYYIECPCTLYILHHVLMVWLLRCHNDVACMCVCACVCVCVCTCMRVWQHLRLTLNNDGKCILQHNHYASIFDMLEHFRQTSIPFDNGGVDIKLKNYVVCWQRAPPGILPPNDAPGDVMTRFTTYGGSVREGASVVFNNLLTLDVPSRNVVDNVYATG